MCSVTMSIRQAVICLQTDCHCFSVYSSLMCSVQTRLLICSLWRKIQFFCVPRVSFRSPRVTDSPLHGTRREGYNRGALGKTLFLRSFSFISQSKGPDLFAKSSSKPPSTSFNLSVSGQNFRSDLHQQQASKRHIRMSYKFRTDIQ